VLDCKSWALSWRGADPTVPPCQQTDGSSIVGKRRWRSFVTAGLKDYAKKRNSIIHPHAVSRISCYLNLGILSIFVLLHDVWEAKSTRGYSAGCQKFLDEVVKWREGSYVHAFAHPNYHTIDVLPLWARKHLGHIHQNRNGLSAGSGYSYEELERGATSDETWNAMQEYLIDTGELHNNARMSW
jgi:deoxyribodipyrimidine photolyase